MKKYKGKKQEHQPLLRNSFQHCQETVKTEQQLRFVSWVKKCAPEMCDVHLVPPQMNPTNGAHLLSDNIKSRVFLPKATHRFRVLKPHPTKRKFASSLSAKVTVETTKSGKGKILNQPPGVRPSDRPTPGASSSMAGASCPRRANPAMAAVKLTASAPALARSQRLRDPSGQHVRESRNHSANQRESGKDLTAPREKERTSTVKVVRRCVHMDEN